MTKLGTAGIAGVVESFAKETLDEMKDFSDREKRTAIYPFVKSFCENAIAICNMHNDQRNRTGVDLSWNDPLFLQIRRLHYILSDANLV